MNALGAEETIHVSHEVEYDCVAFILAANSQFQKVTPVNLQGQQVFWHSAAHVLGEALEQEMGVRLTHGPPIELGPKVSSKCNPNPIPTCG